MVLNLGITKLENRFQKYYEDWLERLIDEKILFVYVTYSVIDNIIISEKVYQVYMEESIYLVKIIKHQIISIRSLYEYKNEEKKFSQKKDAFDFRENVELADRIQTLLLTKNL